jgi:hypothetical protein
MRNSPQAYPLENFINTLCLSFRQAKTKTARSSTGMAETGLTPNAYTGGMR